MRKLDLAYHVLYFFGSCSWLLRHVKHDHMLLTCKMNEFPSRSANHGTRIADFGNGCFWHREFHFWLMTFVLTAQIRYSGRCLSLLNQCCYAP